MNEKEAASIKDIQKYIEDIKVLMKDVSFDEFCDDIGIRYAVSHCLAQIGEKAKRISSDTRA